MATEQLKTGQINPSSTSATSHTGERDQLETIRTYRSVWSLLRGILLFLLMVLILVLIYVYFGGTAAKHGGPLIRLLALIPALYLVNLFRVYYNDLYVFKPDIICHHSGILSFHYAMPVIYYVDVREVLVKQGILGRLLNYGDLYVGTAAHTGYEMNFRGMGSPKDYQKLIETRRNINIAKRVEKKREQDRAQVSSTITANVAEPSAAPSSSNSEPPRKKGSDVIM